MRYDTLPAGAGAIVAQHLPGTSATITFEDGNPPMPPTKDNYALLATLDSVGRARGQGPVEALGPGKRGAGTFPLCPTTSTPSTGLA